LDQKSLSEDQREILKNIIKKYKVYDQQDFNKENEDSFDD